MARQDWAELGGSAPKNIIDHGTVGVGGTLPRPSGGGDFCYSYLCQNGGSDQAMGSSVAHGMVLNQAGMSPTDKGASIRGCLFKGSSAGGCPSFYLSLSPSSDGAEPNIGDTCYKLVLWGEGNSGNLSIVKQQVRDVVDNDSEVLAHAVSSFNMTDTPWLNLRLDCTLNDNGDVVLKVFKNDLRQNPMGETPIWEPVEGLTYIVAATASPLVGGYMGFSFSCQTVGGTGAFTGIEVYRQV